MAIVAPFPAIQYNPQKVGGLERVLTQPYDKITPAMQKDYFARSPYSVAYIIRGEINNNDSSTDNVYTRAAARFRTWREQSILTQQSKPALYAYFQDFQIPGQADGPRMLRKGFIGLGKLEDYGSGVVFRHEQTLSAPKADRLDLLRATRVHFELIFMLYSDEERQIDALLDEVARSRPSVRVTDDYGTVHMLWEIADPGRIAAIQDRMRGRKLIIADGHHRYETALNFRRECQAASPHDGSEPCSYVMMTFVNMEAEGLAILPTHRVVSGMPGFSKDGFLSKAAAYFVVIEYPYGTPDQRPAAIEKLWSEMAAAAAAGQTAIGAIFPPGDSFCLLRLKEEAKHDAALQELSGPERSLDVNILHRIVFGLCLGMDEESVRKEKFLTYVREFEEGVRNVVEQKAQACFFLNPVGIQQVKEVALQGRVLPQKSTDFYPKLLSGLTIYAVDG